MILLLHRNLVVIRTDVTIRIGDAAILEIHSQPGSAALGLRMNSAILEIQLAWLVVHSARLVVSLDARKTSCAQLCVHFT